MTRRRVSHPGGFTLVEAIATMTVVTILGGLGGSMVYSGVQANRDVAVRAQIHEEISTAMESVCGALRGIPAKAGPLPNISGVTPHSISWAGGGQVALSGSTLLLTEAGGAPMELLRNVTQLSLQCYNADGAALATVLSGSATDSVHRVGITITASRDGVSDTLRTKVFIRALQVGIDP